MNSIFSFFKLIRYRQLLVYALCLVLVKTNIIDIFYTQYGVDSSISMLSYIILVFAFICALAGGYIINDCNDQPIDDINRLDKNIFVGNTIKLRTALRFYYAFIFISLGFASVTQILSDTSWILTLILFLNGLLYLYSTRIKRKFLWKNLIIAIIPLVLVFTPLFSEYILISRNFMMPAFASDIPSVTKVGLWFAFMLFLVQLIREIVKDIQDKEGDEKFGVQTIIVKYGMDKTKHIVYLLTGCLMACVCAFQIINFQVNPLSLLVGITLLVHIPLIYFLVELKKATIVQDYGFLADLLSMIFISILFVTFFARNIIVCGTMI